MKSETEITQETYLPTQAREYFVRLDSLRFFAFLAVFVAHVTYFLHYPLSVMQESSFAKAFLQIGDLGVSFFFVLSGFLISYLLEKEWRNTGTISLKNFYIRRVLRIWPLYFLGIGLVVVFSYLIRDFMVYKVGINSKEILAHLFLVGNIYRAFWNTSNEMISVFWSVAVEEQFYLFWPILFILFRKRINWMVCFIILISSAVRWYYHAAYDAREFFTLSVVSDLMIGSWCGIHAHKIRLFAAKHHFNLRFAAMIAIVALLWIRGIVFSHEYPGWFAALEPLLFAVSFSAIVIGNSFRKHQTPSFLNRYFGKISYGLYVFHMIALTAIVYIFKLTPGTLSRSGFVSVALVTFLVTVAMASMSYVLWEKNFLRLKDRFLF